MNNSSNNPHIFSESLIFYLHKEQLDSPTEDEEIFIEILHKCMHSGFNKIFNV